MYTTVKGLMAFLNNSLFSYFMLLFMIMMYMIISKTFRGTFSKRIGFLKVAVLLYMLFQIIFDGYIFFKRALSSSKINGQMYLADTNILTSFSADFLKIAVLLIMILIICKKNKSKIKSQ